MGTKLQKASVLSVDLQDHFDTDMCNNFSCVGNFTFSFSLFLKQNYSFYLVLVRKIISSFSSVKYHCIVEQYSSDWYTYFDGWYVTFGTAKRGLGRLPYYVTFST